jgi:hypothetical protein
VHPAPWADTAAVAQAGADVAAAAGGDVAEEGDSAVGGGGGPGVRGGSRAGAGEPGVPLNASPVPQGVTVNALTP